MRPELIAGLVDAAFPLFGGLYATLLGFRAIGSKPGENPRSDAWHARFGLILKGLGPFLILFGLFRAAMAFARPPG